MSTAAFYAGFQARAERVKDDFLGFLIDAKRSGKTVAAYGAAAKGNTLMNYAGVRARPDRLRGRPQPGQAGQVHAGQPHPDRRRERASTKPGPTTSSCCRGT